MRSWTDLEIFLKKVSLRVSTSKYNRMKQVNDVSLHLQDKWELFGPVGPDPREIWSVSIVGEIKRTFSQTRCRLLCAQLSSAPAPTASPCGSVRGSSRICRN